MSAVPPTHSPDRSWLRRPRFTFACLGALACLGLYLGSDMLLQRVTTYAVICLEPVKDGRCESPGRTLDPATFTVSTERQQVWTSDNGHAVALPSCQVESRRNWRCRSLDGASELGVTAGRPWLARGEGRASDLAFVSAWRYWWLRTGEPASSRSRTAVFR